VIVAPSPSELRASLSVIPIKTDGSKKADLPTWEVYQSRKATAAEINGWFGNGASRGWAIIGGKVSGNLEILDFDEPELLEPFRELVKDHQPDLLKRLPRVATPSGGRHIYYRCSMIEGNQKLAMREVEVPPETKGAFHRNGKHYKLVTLIETRGEGGYVVAPGSPPECHPSGKLYELLNGDLTAIPEITTDERDLLLSCARSLTETVRDADVIKTPAALKGGDDLRPGDDFNQRGDVRALLERHGWTQRGRSRAGERWRRPGGERPSATLLETGSFYVFSTSAAPFEFERGYSPFAVFALLEHGGDYQAAVKALAQQGYGAPLSSDRAKKAGVIDHSATPETWEPPAPFYEFTLPSFPTETLPRWLRAKVEGLAQATQTPADLSAMLSLSACAAAVARNVRIMARRGWYEPLNLYVATALLPGLRKSAVMESLTRPLNDYERELIEGKREEIAKAVSDYRILEARLERAQKDCAKLEGPDLELRREEARELARVIADTKLPVSPQLLCDDVTPEALATLLAEQGGRMALFSAEGGVFEVMAGRYSNGSANFEVYLKAHPGDSLRVNRRGRAEHVKAPALTIGLAVQPDVIRGLAEKPGFRGRGLVGRFLYVLPPSNLGHRKVRAQPLADEIERAYAQNLISLARIEAYGEDPDQARQIQLSPEADDSLAAFEEELEPKLAEDGELGSMGDWAGKLVGAVVRIAGLLHLADHTDRLEPWPLQVSAATLRRAMAIGRYLIPHAKAAYAEMGADPKIEAAKYVLHWIERRGSQAFTKREAFEGTKGRFKEVAALEPALAVLEDHGYIRAQQDSSDRRPGRKPSQRYEVHPSIFTPTSHNSHNSQKWVGESNSANCANCATEVVNSKTDAALAENGAAVDTEDEEVSQWVRA
jgi:replicative DNA helicase